MVKKIAVLTGTRAEFGILLPLIKELNSRDTIDLTVIGTGMHLLPEHGLTINEVRSENFKNLIEVPIWSGNDDSLAVAIDTGVAISKLAPVIKEINPDALILLGDRLEILAAAIASIIQGVSVIHIHGGEVTAGSMDELIRHAVSKLSSLHFATTDEHATRLIKMGEDPKRIFNFGLPALDTLMNLEPMDPKVIESEFKIKFGKYTGLVTFHPAAYESQSVEALVEALVLALKQSTELFPDLNIFITGTNNDIGSNSVRTRLQEFIKSMPDRIFYVESFGNKYYSNVLQSVDFALGNSSSFLLEAPVLGTPSIIIGNRQLGRPTLETVSLPDSDSKSIFMAISKIIAEGKISRHIKNPFGDNGFAKKAANLISNTDFSKFEAKIYYDNFQQ